MSRPGVPTTMCAPCSRLAICGFIGAPPHSDSTLMLASKRASRRISLLTWSASSRVGHSTIACTAKRRGVEPAQHRQRKGGGLAAAGLGLGDEVVAGQRQRQAGSLDRRHREVFELLQVFEQCRGSGRVSKGRGGRGGRRQG